MVLVLKKGVGPLSAGTCVEIVEQPGKTRFDITVYPVNAAPDQDIYIDTTTDNLVELRSRVDEVPVKNRYARRTQRREAWATSSSQNN